MACNRARPTRLRSACWRSACAALLIGLAVVGAPRPAAADLTPQTLPFAQGWWDEGLISTDDQWGVVPGVIGYRGDDLVAADPQTLVADGSATPVDVNANQTNPDGFTTGGVAEFEEPFGTIALSGSATADAPHIVLSIDTTGVATVNVSYSLVDLEASPDNAAQAVALQYRVGAAGLFTNVAAGFVPDATQGPSLRGQVTLVAATLPAEVDDHPLVQVRIITVNAVGNDEWVGIDDIHVATGPPIVPAPTPPANSDRVSEISKSAGSGTTYQVMTELSQAFNTSEGCESYGAAYGAGPSFDPNGPLACAPDVNQLPGTVATENYDHDVIAGYYPTGSTDGFRQLCRREAASVQNIQFARSSSSPSAQAPICTSSNGGNPGTTFRWVSFASENLAWAYWAGGHGVTDLGVAELQGIFVTCTITNWSQLGGPDEPIRVFAPRASGDSESSWEVLLGGNLSSCIPAAFKDGQVGNGERLVREHRANEVEAVDTAHEAVGLDTCAGQPGCASADDERWSIFASFSCAMWTSQPAARGASSIGDVAGQGCSSPTHAGQHNLYNVFAQAPGAGFPGVSSAVRRFTDMRPAFPPTNPTANGYLCMPLNRHARPEGDAGPGVTFAHATRNYGVEKQAILQANGFLLHKDDPAYQPGGVTDADAKPFCKQAEWIVNAAGSMTFTGTNQGLPSGS